MELTVVATITPYSHILQRNQAMSNNADNDGKKDSNNKDVDTLKATAKAISKPHRTRLSMSASRSSKKPVLDKLFIKSRGLPPPSISGSKKPSGRRKIKSTLYTVLNPRSRQMPAVVFKFFISNVIVLDFIFFVLSTEPTIKSNETYVALFEICEGVTSTIFLLEYLARMYTITENQKYSHYGPFWGRMHHATTMASLIDLFATLPWFIEVLSRDYLELPKLSYLRIFRLLRILKTNGFVQAVDAVWRVIYYNRQIMYMSMFVGLFMILTTSILMYYLRPRNDYNKTDEFDSILSTMYLATLMLTGQGGPEGDLPWYTKSVVLLTSAFSIGMFAIPVSMLTWGFEAEAERCAKRARQIEKRQMTDSPISSSQEEYSTDEEYKKIIAGEASEDEDEDATARAMKLFLQADADGSGAISFQEYLELQRRNAAKENSQKSVYAKGDLSARMDALEKKVDNIADKVDKLCAALLRPTGEQGASKKKKPMFSF